MYRALEFTLHISMHCAQTLRTYHSKAHLTTHTMLIMEQIKTQKQAVRSKIYKMAHFAQLAGRTSGHSLHAQSTKATSCFAQETIVSSYKAVHGIWYIKIDLSTQHTFILKT